MYDFKDYKTLKISSSKIVDLYEGAYSRIGLTWRIKYKDKDMYVVTQYNFLAIIRAVLIIPIKILFEGLGSLPEILSEIKDFIRDYQTYEDAWQIDEYDSCYDYLCELRKKQEGE